MSKVHELKCWPESFEGIISREKTFEVRLDDRGYELGDIVILKEWVPEEKVFTGRTAIVYVSYLLRRWPGIMERYVVMSIKLVVVMSE